MPSFPRFFRQRWPGVFLVLMLHTISVQATDWYRWRGPDLNGISHEKGWRATWPDEGPKHLWKASVGLGYSSVVVSQGRLFTMGNKADVDTVYAFDAASGK